MFPSMPAPPNPTQQAPPGPPPNLGNSAALLGGTTPGVNASTPGPTPEDRVNSYMSQIRDLHMQLDGLGEAHPEALEDLRKAKQALIDSMGKVAAAMSSPDQSATPPTY